MKKELSNKQIYDDFVNKTILNEDEQDVLIRYIRGDSLVKISDETQLSTATVSRIIAKVKLKYDNYKKLEIAKLLILR